MEFKLQRADASRFSDIAVVENRLWVSSDGGVVAIDPVDESWTKVSVGWLGLYDAEVITCGSENWLVLADVVALLDVAHGTSRVWTAQDGPKHEFHLRPTCGYQGLWYYFPDDGELAQVPASGEVAKRYQTRSQGVPRSDFAQSLGNVVYLLAPRYESGARSDFYRFDASNGDIARVQLPDGANGIALERRREYLVVRTREQAASCSSGHRTPS